LLNEARKRAELNRKVLIGKLAASLCEASGEKYTALKLPFPEIAFVEKGSVIEFDAGENSWKAGLSSYAGKRIGAASRPGRRGGAVARPPAGPPRAESADRPASSPDGLWEGFIRNYNVHLRPKGKGDAFPLSYDGSEGNYYAPFSIAWSPDSKKIVACRNRPGYHRQIHFVESSPWDQLQPKHLELEYAKPGEVLDLQQPVLFQVETRTALSIDKALFSQSEATACRSVKKLVRYPITGRSTLTRSRRLDPSNWRAISPQYQARIVSGLATQATCSSALRPSLLPISASVALSGSDRRKRVGRCDRKMRFSTARYSFSSSSRWFSRPVTYAHNRAYLLPCMVNVHPTWSGAESAGRIF
jgi:hypothetical protein